MTEQFIQYLQLFRNIPKQDIDVINAAFELRSVTASSSLLQEGKTAKELFFICKGVLRIVGMNDKGLPVTYSFLKENQFCTILNSFNNDIPALEGIEAACDTILLVIHKRRLLQLYKQIPYLE